MILDPRGGLAGELVQRAAPAPGTGAGKRPPKPVLDAATQAIDRARTDWSKAPKAMMALSRDRSLGARKRRMASDLAWHVVRARRLLDVLVGGDDGASSADLVRAAAILFEGAPFELASAGRDGLEDPRHALLAYVLTTSPDPATALGVATSLPDWFAAELLADHEPEVAVAIARSLLGRAPLALRVHRDRLSRDAALAELIAEAGGWSPNAGCVLVLGHNPGWEDALESLTDSSELMTTGNAALLVGEGERWDQALRGRWTLEALIRPRELEAAL